MLRARSGCLIAGSRRQMMTSATAPIGRLTKKIQCQPPLSVRKPPSAGPISALIPKTAPNSPWYLPRSAGVKRSPMTASAIGKSDPAPAAPASALDEATYYLRAIGLTWREIGVLHEIEKLQTAGQHVERRELAEALQLSPETLRVHITRIRAKLDIGDRRGDAVLLEAALARRPVA